MKNRILIFSTAYYPFVGGAEVAVKEITDRLGEDFEFDLITTKLEQNLPNEEKIGVINVYRLGNGSPTFDKLLLPFRGAVLAWKLNKKQEYFCFWAVMVSFGSIAGYIYNILQSIMGGKRVPIILTLQEGDSEDYLNNKWGGMIDLSWRLALKQTDLLTAISNFLLNRAKRFGFDGEGVLVPNGVDIELFSKEIDQKTKDDLKKTLGKKEGDIFLITTSRLTHKNAIDDVISALVSLPTNVIFMVIGVGDLGVKLQKQVYDLGLKDRVNFLGFIDYTEIPKYLSVCDIFIRPSRSEGFGNSFIEAMVAGLPVIATPVGGIVDFISDKDTGVFCLPDNPQSIVQSVKLITEDNPIREKIVQNAKKLVVEKYSWDKVATEMKSVFDKISK